MTNIVLTSTANAIKADFGDYYPLTIKTQKGIWRKGNVDVIRVNTDHVEIITNHDRINVTHSAGDAALVVDSVDGVVPSGLDDLYNKISALIE